MLKFDMQHQSINGSIKEQKNKINIKKFILAGMLVSSVFLYGGCTKTVDCDIKEAHAHYYVNSSSFDKYMISEKEYQGNWFRTDEYIFTDKEEKELINFENDKGLFNISLNKEKINEITANQKDYKEYRYSYTWLQPIPHFQYSGENMYVSYTYVPHTGYSWTDNPNHSRLTGEERVVHYVYYGYKIVKNTDGEYEVVQSEMVDNLSDLPEDYIYVKKDFYKKVNLANKNLEVDYEDGPEEDRKLTGQHQVYQDYYDSYIEGEKQKVK